VKVCVVGGGIAGLAAARELEAQLPEAVIALVEREPRLGGKLVTEREDGFVVEGAADSFLSRKPRGVGLAEELGLALVGRRPDYARSFVRAGVRLHRLPEGLTGMIPTDLAALDASGLLSAAGRARLAAEAELPPEPAAGDESIASFVRRRLGDEAYERMVEPLMTGIYGGDGEQLSLAATFPNLRALELEHGSVLRGLRAQPPPSTAGPPFVAPRRGTAELVDAIADGLERTHVATAAATRVMTGRVETEGEPIDTDAVILAVPAYETAQLLADLDPELAREHAEIPYASSVIVTFAFSEAEAPLDGYGYVVPSAQGKGAQGTDALAATWTTRKWEARAPEGLALVRVYLGRFGRRDVTACTDDELIGLARSELRQASVVAEPDRTWIHRWTRGMPQYVLGHPDRLARIDAALERHPWLALAGAAYRGVGIPDCIASGEEAAHSIARALAEARA
jgi:protoporphyrinogen/coproporphyrinogen III oxidase